MIDKVQLDITSANSGHVTIGNIEIYFSYKTPIAFYSKKGLVIRVNDWNTTTGKHLNAISTDKSIRISGDKFMQELTEALKEIN